MSVDGWLVERLVKFVVIVRIWIEEMCGVGGDVCELIYDGYFVVCMGLVVFVYVVVFMKYVNVGFYCGVELVDLSEILVGVGKLMWYVKIFFVGEID